MGPRNQQEASAVASDGLDPMNKTTTVKSLDYGSTSKPAGRVSLRKQKGTQKFLKGQRRQGLLSNSPVNYFSYSGINRSTSAGHTAASTRNIPSAFVVGDLGLPKARKVSGPRPVPAIARSTLVNCTASQPPLSGACPLIDRLPQEVHDIILSYLFDGAVVLDKGWLLKDYQENKGMNPRDLPVFYRVSEPTFPGQSTARISPVSSRANTSVMFTCKKLYHAYAPQVYKRSAFALSLLPSARDWLLPKCSGSSNLRNLRSPWITTLHIHIPVYGTPRFRSDIQHQAQYYLSWRKIMASLAKECTNLKEVHLSVDVPQKLPLRVDLRQDWAWALLPLALCKSLSICIVELNMDWWHSDMVGAFEEYLTIMLKGGDRADGVAALESARTQAFCTEEGMCFLDEWNDFVMWNEQEQALIIAAAGWELMLPVHSRSRATRPRSGLPWETVFDHLR